MGNLCKIQPGYAFKSKDFCQIGPKIIKIRNIQKSNSVIDLSFGDSIPNEIYENIENKFHLSSGDILIAMTGAELGKIGIIPRTNSKLLLNQRVGKIISKHNFLIYFFLKEDSIQNQIQSFSAGSSAQGNISDKNIENIPIPLSIDSKIIEDFTVQTSSFYEKIVSNFALIIKLTKTRDALLPKLMSGEIRV